MTLEIMHNNQSNKLKHRTYSIYAPFSFLKSLFLHVQIIYQNYVCFVVFSFHREHDTSARMTFEPGSLAGISTVFTICAFSQLITVNCTTHVLAVTTYQNVRCASEVFLS